MSIFIDGMQGFGDGIYIRGFVKTFAQKHDVTIATPWPELYSDEPNIKFQKKQTSLRTQAKNIRNQIDNIWTTEVSFDHRFNIHYGAGTNIPDDLGLKFGCLPTWGLPSFPKPDIEKPYIVIRPATLRKEWFAASRNPIPKYIDQVARWLSDRYRIISIADLEDGHEWLEGDAPFAHEQYHQGELNTSELIGMCQNAAAIVGGVGWIVPFALSSGVPAFIISGGCGGYNAPEKLVNETMDQSKIHFVKPDNFCICRDMKHNCDKRITDLKGHFDDWQSIL